MRKIFIVILLFSGIALSQVKEDQVKNTLINMTIRWDNAVMAKEQLQELTQALVIDLQALENPSEELIAIMKKYQIYIEPDVSE